MADSHLNCGAQEGRTDEAARFEDRAGAFAGRTVLVAGGAGTVGTALSGLIVAEGGRVVVGDVARPAMDELVRRLGPAAASSVLDVTTPESWALATSVAYEKYGCLDAIVNCAGLVRLGATRSLPVDELRRVLDVGLAGAHLCLQAAADALEAGGAVVLTASALGRSGAPGHGALAAVAAGVEALARAGAVELAPDGLRVNTVLVGLVAGPSLAEYRWRGAEVGELAALAPLQRLVEPIEAATAISTLIGPHAGATTGAVVVVDAGLSAGPTLAGWEPPGGGPAPRGDRGADDEGEARSST